MTAIDLSTAVAIHVDVAVGWGNVVASNLDTAKLMDLDAIIANELDAAMTGNLDVATLTDLDVAMASDLDVSMACDLDLDMTSDLSGVATAGLGESLITTSQTTGGLEPYVETCCGGPSIHLPCPTLSALWSIMY